MMILTLLLILAFTIWTMVPDALLGRFSKVMFLLSLVSFVGMMVMDHGFLGAFPFLALSFLGLAAYGFTIQNIVTHNISRLMLCGAVIGITMFNYDSLHEKHHNYLRSFQEEVDHENELIVKVRHGSMEKVREILASKSYVASITSWNVTAPDITELDDYLVLNIIDSDYNFNTLSQIEKISDVIWIEENETWNIATESYSATDDESEMKYSSSINDPRLSDQWNFSRLGMDHYHEILRSGIKPRKPAVLYILDSGIDFSHEDLRGAVSSYPSQNQKRNETDPNGHGSHCAGIAGAVTGNGVGIASFNPGKDFMEIRGIAVGNAFGLVSQEKVIKAVIEAVDAGADVINMSFGGRSNQISQTAYEDLLAYADKKGVIIVAAAGNSADDAAKYLPSGSDRVITVSAINRYDERAQFSNSVKNTNLGIAAPGTSILSTYKSKYRKLDGTSMAAPHVAGLVTVMRSIRPDLTKNDIYTILIQTGTDSNDVASTGKIIQPSEAIKAILD